MADTLKEDTDQSHSRTADGLRSAVIVATDVHRDGGMERAHREIVDGLLRRGWSIRLISRTSDLPDHPALAWHQVPTPGRPFVLAYPLFVLWASMVVLRLRARPVNTIGAIILPRVDLVTLQFCHAGLRARGGVRRSKQKGWVFQLSDLIGSRMSRAMERWSYRRSRSSRFVAVSSNLARELEQQFDRSEVDVVPNGVDLDVFRPDRETRRRIRRQLGVGEGDLLAVFSGGDWERKGLAVTIDAIGRTPAWSLLVLGRGDQASYARLAEDKGARVIFVGHTNRPQDYLAASDAFVFPTAYEGFSLAVIEGAAAGLPLLTTLSSGADELLLDGENGWWIERDPNDVARRLEFLRDPDLRSRMGTAATHSAQAFAWQRVVDQYETQFERLLSGR